LLLTGETRVMSLLTCKTCFCPALCTDVILRPLDVSTDYYNIWDFALLDVFTCRTIRINTPSKIWVSLGCLGEKNFVKPTKIRTFENMRFELLQNFLIAIWLDFFVLERNPTNGGGARNTGLCLVYNFDPHMCLYTFLTNIVRDQMFSLRKLKGFNGLATDKAILPRSDVIGKEETYLPIKPGFC
jgi:hypothetical protein